MPTPKKPAEDRAGIKQERDSSETLSLVDYFDRMDREAFRRMLKDHDRTGPATSGT